MDFHAGWSRCVQAIDGHQGCFAFIWRRYRRQFFFGFLPQKMGVEVPLRCVPMPIIVDWQRFGQKRSALSQYPRRSARAWRNTAGDYREHSWTGKNAGRAATAPIGKGREVDGLRGGVLPSRESHYG
jgi:hypothetical protein